jgi:hypothetical protein
MRRLVLFAAGLVAGVIVTRRLHDRPPTDFWARPLGSMRWRRADVPLGGVTAIVVSAVAPRVVRPNLRSLGWGAIVGCLTVAALDPLRGRSTMSPPRRAG